jgi:hypothetical protein
VRETSRRSHFLVLGFFDETRILQVSRTNEEGTDDFEVEETELLPFKGDAATLFAGRLDTLCVQVTNEGVEFASVGGTSSTQWSPGGKNKVTSAASSGSLLLVGLQGGEVVLLADKEGVLTQERYESFPMFSHR